jgi:hypothetical protein
MDSLPLYLICNFAEILVWMLFLIHVFHKGTFMSFVLLQELGVHLFSNCNKCSTIFFVASVTMGPPRFFIMGMFSTRTLGLSRKSYNRVLCCTCLHPTI